MPTLSQLLAGETPDSTKSFGDYFDYINKSLAIIQKVRVDPLCGWKKVDDDEYELVPPKDSVDPEDWQAKVRDALRMAGTSISVYHVKEEDIDVRGGLPRLDFKIKEEQECEVIACDADELTLQLDPPPAKDELLFLELDDRTFKAQKSALQTLQKTPKPEHHPLLRLFSCEGCQDDRWPDFASGRSPDPKWQVIDPTYPGAAAQIDFIKAAMHTPDFVLLKGPPGSGKTTAISELVIQMAAQRPGARILLTASTHVAIDNVLEKLADHAADVTCLRIASDNTSKRVEHPKVQDMLLKRVVRKEHQRLLGLHSSPKTAAEKAFRGLLDGKQGEEELRKVILLSATLAAGTPQGILQHPAIKPSKDSAFAIPPCFFDMIIVDEASKTSLLEFLIPAVHARTWVIVGDDRQLPPYMGRPEVGAGLFALAPDVPEKAIEEAAGNLVRWREFFFQQLDEQKLRIADPELERAARLLRKICLPSVYGLLAQGHGQGGEPTPLSQGLPRDALRQRSFALTHQNRMHPEISAFPRQAFYSTSQASGEPLLQDSPNVLQRPWPLANLFTHRSIWVNVPTPPNQTSEDGRRQESNPAEAFIVARYILQAAQAHPQASMAVISFYKAQLKLIRKTIEKLAEDNGVPPPKHIEHLTVDSCQGREADMVFVSFTFAGGSRFVRDPNRLNVALTRARHQLVLVGNRDGMLRKAAKPGEERNYLAELAQHHRERQMTPTPLLEEFYAERQRGPAQHDTYRPKPSTQSNPRKPSARPPTGPLENPFNRLDPGDFRP
jgi:energy-coupling factor transporter ATP-binding protein EcfA2